MPARSERRQLIHGLVDLSERQRFVELADAHERSVSAELRVAIREHLFRHLFRQSDPLAAGTLAFSGPASPRREIPEEAS